MPIFTLRRVYCLSLGHTGALKKLTCRFGEYLCFLNCLYRKCHFKFAETLAVHIIAMLFFCLSILLIHRSELYLMWNRGISRHSKTLDVNFKIYTSENAGKMQTEIWAQSQETAVDIPTPVESAKLY